MVKLIVKTYRDVNIAIANEFSRLAGRFGVDVWKAIEIADRHPRVKILRPGPGVGGHCISVDPWFFVEAAPDLTPLIRTAREVNHAELEYVVELVRRAVAEGGTEEQGGRGAEEWRGWAKEPWIRYGAALGLADKPNVDDLRESPAIEVVGRPYEFLELEGQR